jgi:FkbM family methyltransferase
MSAAQTAPTYSQYGEDQFILANTPEHGRFLDIGAWHPTAFSNTRVLWERGWSGIMIEPSPGPFMSLLNEYGNDERITLILAAIGPERCCVNLWASDDAVSTTERANYDAWKAHAKFRGSFYTPVLTIRDLFNQFGGGGFDFVNIDTEGTSVNVFLALLETALYPSCICVEHDQRIVECSQAAHEKGYRQVCLNGTNVVYAR